MCTILSYRTHQENDVQDYGCTAALHSNRRQCQLLHVYCVTRVTHVGLNMTHRSYDMHRSPRQ